MFHIFDAGTGGGQDGCITIHAGMASESTAGNDSCHDQKHIGTYRLCQREYDGRHYGAHSPEGTCGKAKGSHQHKGNGRENGTGQEGFRDLNDIVRQPHLRRDILQKKSGSQKDQYRQHIRKALDDHIKEVVQCNHLTGHIHYKAGCNGNYHSGEQIAGGNSHSDQYDHGNSKIPQIAIFLIALVIFMVILSAGITVNLAGLFHPLIGLFHGTDLRHHTDAEQEYHYQRKDRIKAERQGMYIGADTGRIAQGLYSLLLKEQAGIEHSPGGKRKHDAYRRTGGIQHISQGLSRKLFLIEYVLHAYTDGKHIQIIVHKDQNTQDKGGQKSLLLGIAPLGYYLGKAKAALGFLQKSDQAAKQPAGDDDPDIVCGSGLQHRAPLGQKACAIQKQGTQQGTCHQKFHALFGQYRTDNDQQDNENRQQSHIHNTFTPLCRT